MRRSWLTTALAILLIVGCGPSSPGPSDAVSAPEATPSSATGVLRFSGEVFFDATTESEFRADGCLLLATPTGGYELVLPKGWRVFYDEEGVRIADAAGHRLTRSYYAAFLEGTPLDGRGCMGSTPVQVQRELPPPANVGTVFVESVSLPSGGWYIEGSIGIIRILDDAGNILAQQPAPHGTSFALPVGAATLLSFQKACDMNCDMGASGYFDLCETPIDRAHVELTVTVLLRPTDGCTIELRDGPPADTVGVLTPSRQGASAPYPGERCAYVDGVIPVPPVGWTLRSLREGRSLELVDPSGVVVARDGQLVWLNGVLTAAEKPFGCDGQQRLDITEVVMARAID